MHWPAEIVLLPLNTYHGSNDVFEVQDGKEFRLECIPRARTPTHLEGRVSRWKGTKCCFTSRDLTSTDNTIECRHWHVQDDCTGPREAMEDEKAMEAVRPTFEPRDRLWMESVYQYQNEFVEQLLGFGIKDSHGPTTPPTSATRLPSLTHTNSSKRATDSTSGIHQRSKHSKGKSRADTNSTALLKFVSAQDRQNEILEQWITIQNKACGVAGSSKVGLECIDDSYSECVLLMQSILGEDEIAVFLKGCKELENGFAHKAFLVMSDA
ncbi:hypothetical protein CJ030_MR6G010826 [Morella rubra]|uniref:Uncharacterized protein n=1 Tax=Morella rubra TaxID=262757 RepID=A0A6A1VHG7_9ROSI|nr:hypothetical protein CJ030_MR6G010826 [Morella rubra]